MTPQRRFADSPHLGEILSLIKDSFAYMEGRIDPPSSIESYDLDAFRADVSEQELWTFGEPVTACILLKPQENALYLGRLAVAQHARGGRLGQKLVEHACARARHHCLVYLELKVRIELTDNQQFFSALGFYEASRSAHSGYDRPTYITLQRPV